MYELLDSDYLTYQPILFDQRLSHQSSIIKNSERWLPHERGGSSSSSKQEERKKEQEYWKRCVQIKEKKKKEPRH